MRIQSIVVGYLGTNCYILGDEATGTCAVIDPGASAGAILGKIREMGLKAETILLTHGHYDHIMAVPELVRQTGARVCIHKKDQWLLDCDEVLRYGTRAEHYTVPHVDVFLEDGMEVTQGSLTIRVLHTPGHTAGCCCFVCGDALFSGDTLFHESCGRTDLETGDMEDMFRSLARLAALEGNYRVFPGHMSSTSLDYERQFNPYMREAQRR